MMFKTFLLKFVSIVTDFLRRTPIYNSKIIRRIQNILVSNIYRNNTVKVGEFTIKIHSPTEYVSKRLILSGGYEKEELDILSSLAKPGDTFVDVGANIGLYTLHLSRAVGTTGRVLAFEPDPDNLAILHENIKLNNCDNVTVFPFALGASHSTQKLYVCKDNKGFQGWANFNGLGDTIDVEVRRLDDFLDLAPALMKIDVEGAEPFVWQGITHKPQNLLFEFVPYQLLSLGNNPLDFLQTLVREDYVLFQIKGSKLISATPEEIIGIAQQSGEYNLLAQKRGK